MYRIRRQLKKVSVRLGVVAIAAVAMVLPVASPASAVTTPNIIDCAWDNLTGAHGYFIFRQANLATGQKIPLCYANSGVLRIDLIGTVYGYSAGNNDGFFTYRRSSTDRTERAWLFDPYQVNGDVFYQVTVIGIY